MPPSIRASVSAELASSGAPAIPVLPRRSTFAAVAATRAGALGLALTAIVLLAALFAPLLGTVDPFVLSGPSLAPPTLAHPMGTDALGRDLYSGILYGARTSLIVAAGAGLIAFASGALIGMVAGYAGGITDNVLMRITELFQVLPRFLLIIVAVAMFGAGVDRLIVVLGLTSWPVLARVVRAEVLSLRQQDFVLAAQATGASPAHILRHELLPNVLPSAVVMLGLLFGQVLLVEASLGFLGIGDPNVMSWGALAGQAQSFLRVAWWLPFFPGLAITIAVLASNLMADALTRALGGR